MPPSDAFVPGKQSNIDLVLYGIVALGAGTVVGEVDFLAVDVGTNGKKRTNLPQKNTLPANWSRFEVRGIAFKILKEVALADAIAVVNDASYSFKVADYEYKFGHLTELVVATSLYATNSTNVATYQSDMRYGAFVQLQESIPIDPNNAMNFVVKFETDNVNLRLALCGVYLKGVLQKRIAG